MNFLASSISPDTLDDWLESDLRQSGILPTGRLATLQNAVKTNLLDDLDNKALSDPSALAALAKDLPMMNMTPLLQALAILHASNQKAFPSMPPVVNPMDMTKKPTPLHTTPIAALPAPVSDHTISSKKRPSPVDTNDAMTLKRQKNTDAARRSRMRKALKMEALEKRVAELEDANKLLLNKVTDAEIERNSCQDKVDGHRHTIEALEKELATAHKALLDESQASPEASATT